MPAIGTSLASVIEMRHIRAFLTVAHTLNFSRAADELYMTQPAMSRIIQELERELGAALFLRDKRYVRLTEVGVALLPMAQTAIDHFDAWLRHAAAVTSGHGGSLRLAFFGPSFRNYRRTSKALRDFRAQYPDVDVEIAELSSHPELLAALRSRRVEVIFGREVYSVEDVLCRILRFEPLVCAMSSTHRLAKRARISLKELQSEHVLTPRSRLGPCVDVLLDAARHAGVHIDTKREFNQLLSVFSAIEDDGVIAVMPETALSRSDKRFRGVPFDDEQLRVPYIMSHLTSDLSPAAKAFVELVLEGQAKVA
jgi:DNA-binding transcriptional LysR family regulator